MSIYDSLNEQQKKGVFTTKGPVLIIAGAGSGKTKVLTHRIAYLIEEQEVNPYNILAITFTNKAATQMRERVEALVGLDAGSSWIMTFHAACIRILRRYGEYIGYSSNFTIYDADDQKAVVKDIVKKLGLDPKLYKEKSVIANISKAKEKLVSPDEYEMRNARELNKRNIANIYREYQKQLKNSNAMDFDDIICKTVELFEKFPEILEYYQDRFQYIMVDEYQDTNMAQFRFIRLLADKYRNLCVVGDDDQSIYKFRGADIQNILSFENVYPEATIIKLEQNYRSTQNILDVANSVIKYNKDRRDKSLWSENGTGNKIFYNEYGNAFEEAGGIAADLKNRVEKGADYKDFAILYRTNAQSRAIEEKLVQSSIPYKVYGGVNFYGRKEIKDILSYLKTIDNGCDDLACRRIINIPKRGIGDTTVGKILSYASEREISFYEALLMTDQIDGITKAARAKIEPFCLMIRAFKTKAKNMSVKELIKDIVDSINYREYLLENDEEAIVNDRILNIEELISKAALFEENYSEGASTLSAFLEDVALVADVDSMEDDKNVVTVMTLHSAKGLEFPVVYLAGMEDGLFPSYMSIQSEDPSDLEEERRLCYVGITRAKKELILSMSRLRMINGETRMEKKSRFINEIPREYLLQSGQGIYKIADVKNQKEISSDNKMQSPALKSSYSSHKTYSPAQPFSLMQKGVNKIAASVDELGYNVGDKVKHIKFGVGTVKSIVVGGKDFEVVVEFSSSGTKKMFASFAKLVKTD